MTKPRALLLSLLPLDQQLFTSLCFTKKCKTGFSRSVVTTWVPGRQGLFLQGLISTRSTEGPAEPGCLGAADQTALHGPQSPASSGDTEQLHYSTRRPCTNTASAGGQREEELFPSGLEVGLHRSGLLTYPESRQGFPVHGKRRWHRRNRRWTAKEALERRKSKYQKPQDK